MIDWSIEGTGFGNCNCVYGCPCQFEALPTQGHCRGFGAVCIGKGHFDDVRLDGLNVVMLYAWPGPIFEGKGEMQCIVDVRADPRQREALVKILHGEETEEGATIWWVFRAMSDTAHRTLFLPIECDINVEARTARIVVADVIAAVGAPIISPVTGREHRVRIAIPEGIDFDLAEIGSGSTTADAAIKLDLKDSYGQFNLVRQTGRGRMRESKPL